MPVKRLLVIIFLLVVSVRIYSQQQTADVGLFLGGATPFSDYSSINLGRSVHLNYGGFYRYNFNSRYSLRLNALFGNVGASGYLNNDDNLYFKKSVFDFAAIFEVNYLDFLLGVEKWKFSPYVHYGLGLTFYNSSTSGNIITPNFVIGTGAKYALSKRLAVGAEITSRKLGNDDLDNLNNPYQLVGLKKVNDLFHNNDWINYYGLTLTYKFYWGSKPCPAYNSLN